MGLHQATVIREHLYRTQAEQARVALLTRGRALPPGARKSLEEIEAKVDAEAARYEKEKKEIEPAARRLEAHRDLAGAKDMNFEFAAVLFQIAIVLGSVTILSESRTVLVACLIFGTLAVLLGANGFLLLVTLPF